jgi:hypothetical protein
MQSNNWTERRTGESNWVPHCCPSSPIGTSEASSSAGWAHDNHFRLLPPWFDAVVGRGVLSSEAQLQLRFSLVRRQQQHSEAAQLEVAPATFAQS